MRRMRATWLAGLLATMGTDTAPALSAAIRAITVAGWSVAQRRRVSGRWPYVAINWATVTPCALVISCNGVCFGMSLALTQIILCRLVVYQMGGDTWNTLARFQ
ncbi:hypothetical protein EX238_20595 [Providencia rettgeri]|nr:hypothetical protein [Providencia rettgeri]